MSSRASTAFYAAVTAVLVSLVFGGCGGGPPGPGASSAGRDRSAAGIRGKPGAEAPVRFGSAGQARVIVGLKHRPRATDQPLARKPGVRVRSRYRIIPAVSASVTRSALAALRRDPEVAYVEGDPRARALADQLGWGAGRVDAEVIWGGTDGATTVVPGSLTGRGVKVAIVDSGVDYTHPDLAPNYANGVNCITGGDPKDDNGHGSHCAGIVAAAANGSGVIGVAPRASLYGLKVLDSTGWGYYSDIIEGIDWCAANGIQVASLSLGGPDDSASLKAACDAAYAQNVLLVAAAGNSGSGTDTVNYPAKYSSVIAVGATDSANARASFSSTGPTVELAAPGVSIYSTTLNGTYQTYSGTSQACPHVAGIAALLIESGIASAPALRSRLTSTAVDLGSAGRDTSFGFGLANAFRAVRNIPTSDTSPTVSLTAPAAGATVSGVVTITATATDGGGVVRVDFLVDGVVKGSDTDPTGGWSVTWDSKPATNATHTITAVATDTAGLMTTSAARTVTVKNLYGNIAVTVKNSRTKALVPGATVEVVGMGLSGVTDAYGKCTFTGILAGARTVKISAAGYTALSKSVTVSGGRTASLAVSLVPSA